MKNKKSKLERKVLHYLEDKTFYQIRKELKERTVKIGE